MTVFSSRIWCWECSQGKDKALIFSRASHLALSSVTTALHLVSDRGKTSVVWLTVVETSTHRAKIPHPCLSALNMVRRARWLVGFPAFHLRLTQLYFLNLHTREFTCRHWRWPIETNTCSDLPPQTRQFDRLVGFYRRFWTFEAKLLMNQQHTISATHDIQLGRWQETRSPEQA